MDILSESLEGSSSSSTHGHKYDVYLSFRGIDTRYSFTDHLYKALIAANISTFLDDEEIETFADLKRELESTIKASRASIIVLSTNYAYSTWCLDELVLILEQRVTSNHIVIPIFYHVEPTHVRKLERSFGDAMAKHKQAMEAETDANKRSQLAQKFDRWIKALREVANLKGYDANRRLETEFIEEIIKDTRRRLHVSLRGALPQLIGMNDSIKFLTSWLKDGSSHTVDILTISGMRGIGKTSLAKYVYTLHMHEFDTSSFIENINKIADGKFNGLLDLQKQLYNDISRASSIEHGASEYTSMIENTVARKKTFLVLDDIDRLDQLDALLGSKGFYPGSKIIITTTNASLTDNCALVKNNIKPKHAKHFLEGLYETESRQLLCKHAFRSNDPKAGYEEVSDKIVDYCEGHPLALEYLGKSLHNQHVAYWEWRIGGLKKELDSHVNNVLRMSFDSLPSQNDKEMFKHIACFFVGMDSDVTEIILNACDINTASGIKNLMDRCLLRIGRNNELKMHRLIQEMGRFIVREESFDKPWKRSRVWRHEESFRVLKRRKGSGNVLGLALDMRMLEKESLQGSFKLKTEALSNMDNLMLLQLNYVQLIGSYKNFPEELRWLCMHGFPLKSIPSELPAMGNLVVLDMSYSNIESFGICYSKLPPESRKKSTESRSKNQRLLRSLKILNLSFSEQLGSLGGFAELPALERLIVRNCISLLEICESIEDCVELAYIDLSNCSKLEKYPRTLGMSKNVRTLLLDGCSLLESRTDIDQNTETSLSAVLETIPSDFKFFENSLPSSLVKLSLANNNLSAESFPMDFSCLSMLKDLYLDDNPIVSLPSCVRRLPRLEVLSMRNCKMLTSVELPPRTLTHLNLISDYKPLLRKVVFDPDMSPLNFIVNWELSAPSSFEFEGMVKIQPIAGVEEKVLLSLGWTEVSPNLNRGTKESKIQMYYEFGIFSTVYGGEEMPSWIMNTSNGRSISFTIPWYPNNLKGLNFCCVQKFRFRYHCFDLPKIIICNKTKNRTWIYKHCTDVVTVGGYWVIFLSHWMFGMNEMEDGDNVTITASENLGQVMKCGVSLVYDDGKMDEDVLGYYKSWNHIIGGDLTGFQLTTGEYLLYIKQFMRNINSIEFSPHFVRCGIADGASFKERKVWFRALSQRKSGILVSHMRFRGMIDQRGSFI